METRQRKLASLLSEGVISAGEIASAYFAAGAALPSLVTLSGDAGLGHNLQSSAVNYARRAIGVPGKHEIVSYNQIVPVTLLMEGDRDALPLLKQGLVLAGHGLYDKWVGKIPYQIWGPISDSVALYHAGKIAEKVELDRGKRHVIHSTHPYSSLAGKILSNRNPENVSVVAACPDNMAEAPELVSRNVMRFFVPGHLKSEIVLVNNPDERRAIEKLGYSDVIATGYPNTPEIGEEIRRMDSERPDRVAFVLGGTGLGSGDLLEYARALSGKGGIEIDFFAAYDGRSAAAAREFLPSGRVHVFDRAREQREAAEKGNSLMARAGLLVTKIGGERPQVKVYPGEGDCALLGLSYTQGLHEEVLRNWYLPRGAVEVHSSEEFMKYAGNPAWRRAACDRSDAGYLAAREGAKNTVGAALIADLGKNPAREGVYRVLGFK
jgi:hypothetical protein